MARLPIPGQDGGTWGSVLNDYLTVAHNADGSIKTSALPPSDGATGPTGPTGPAGVQGATGPQGATGVAGVIAADAPVTYNSGTQTVGITVGTAANTVAAGDDTRITNKEVQILVTDPAGSDLATGDGKAYYLVPTSMNGLNVKNVQASVTTVSSSGTPTIQLARIRSGTPADVLSTRVTIDANESTSYTAAIAPVIDAANDDLVTGDFLRVDVDVAGTGAKGLNINITVGP